MIGRNRVWVGAGVLGLMGALSLQGCAKGDDSTGGNVEGDFEVGGLSLGLTLPDGSQVTTVNYVITKSGSEVRTGVLEVGPDGRVSATIGGLVAGSDYRVDLTAPREPGASCVGGAPFTIEPNQTASVTIVMQCDDLGLVDGNLSVNGTFNICPKVTSTTISPTTVAVGSAASLSATARDRDNDPLTFAWTAPSGSFSAPGSSSTSYTCASAGVQTLTLSVDDGPLRGCTRSATVMITCTGAIMDAGSDAGRDASSDAGVTSSATAYILPSLADVVVRPLLTVGDSPNLKPDGTPYRMVGIPDGLGAFDNGDGTFTLLANHELSATNGIARAHGGTGAFVSKWTVRKSDQRVLFGEDLIEQVQLWNQTTSSYALASNVTFDRFCAAELAAPSAFYDAASATGFQGRLYMNGEEGGQGRAFAHGLDGVSWELPRLGRQPWENQVASPASGLKTVVIGLDDSSPLGQVYVYVGTKTNAGSAVDRAGLTNGTLYGVKVVGVPAESNDAVIPPGPFTLESLGNVSGQTTAQLETAATTALITKFQRPEDGNWNPSSPNDFYFVSTANVDSNSRLWRLRFTDVRQPELGGQIEAVLSGNEGHRMLDNMTIDTRGHILATEDVGGNERLGKIWRYTITSDQLVEIAAADPARFTTGAPGFLTNDEEASGILDATEILGAGWFLLDVQSHNTLPGELVQSGQLLSIFDPGSL
jgi:hypothetical protein